MQRIETLIHEIERFPDANVQAVTRELVQALLDVHGAGLARILEAVAGTGDAGRPVLDALAGDDLVAGLLLLHGLHPQDLESRVRQALEKVRPLVRSHGGEVELLSAEGGAVRVRLEGCGDQPSTALMLRRVIEEAVWERAPDVTAVTVEGVAPQAGEGHARLIPLPQVGRDGPG
jgi:Fe-S cluster biogenesis protein NfuA